MNKLLITLIFTLVSVFVKAQTVESVKGKWVFSEVYEQEKLDPESTKMLLMFFENLTLDLQNDQKYTALFMNYPEEGIWKLKGKELVLEAQSGKKNSLEIIDISTDKLIVKLSKGTFVLKKSIGTSK